MPHHTAHRGRAVCSEVIPFISAEIPGASTSAWVGVDGCVDLHSIRSRELTVTCDASGAWHIACVLASAEAPTFSPDFSGYGDSKSNTWIKVIFGLGKNLEKPL